MPWISTKEAALVLGKSERTIRRHIKAGKLESREIRCIGGNSGVAYEVFVETAKDLDIKHEKIADTPKRKSKIETKIKSGIAVNIKNKTTKKDEKFADTLPSDRNILSKNTKNSKISQKSDCGQSGKALTGKELGVKNVTDCGHSSKSQISDKIQADKTLTTIEDTRPEKSDRVQNSVQLRTPSHKELQFNDLIQSLEWISIEDSVQVSAISKRSIYNKIARKEILKIVVDDNDTKCGKRTFLHIDGFPIDVREKWKEIQLSKFAKQLPDNISNAKSEFDSYPELVRQKANSRKQIVESYQDLKKYAIQNKLRIINLENDWIKQINEGEILNIVFKRLEVDELSIKTVRRWDKIFRDADNPTFPICLIDKRQLKSGRKSKIDDSMKNEIRQVSVEREHWKASEVFWFFEGKYDYLGLSFPLTLRTVSRIVKQTREDKFLINKYRGNKSYKNNIRQHGHRSNNAYPMELVESDGHTLNIFVYSPYYAHRNYNFRELIRPVLIVWFDVATGLILGWCLSPSETPNAVRTSFVDMCEKFGVPDGIRIDNGSSYKNHIYTPLEFANRKKNTAAKKKAQKLIAHNDYGLYLNMGVKNVSFSLPGNPESKVIEPFWNYAISIFEKTFPVWTGEDFNRRPEKHQVTKKTLIKRFGNQIPTLEQAEELLDQYINMWNNRKRESLKSISGESLSPIEVYKEYPELLEKKPSRQFIDEKGIFPYALDSIVDRGEIYVNGIYYAHPYFHAHAGLKIRYIYDERDISQVRIIDEDGGIWKDPAQAVIPGLQVGDDMQALKQVRHNEKLGQRAYIAIANSSERKPTRNSVNELLLKQDLAQNQIKDSGNNRSISNINLRKRKQTDIEKDREATKTPAPKQIDYSDYLDEIKPKEPIKHAEKEDITDLSKLSSEIKPKPKRKISLDEDDELLKKLQDERNRLYGNIEEV